MKKKIKALDTRVCFAFLNEVFVILNGNSDDAKATVLQQSRLKYSMDK